MSDNKMVNIGRGTVYGSSGPNKKWPVGAKRRSHNLTDPAMAGAAAEEMSQLCQKVQADENSS